MVLVHTHIDKYFVCIYESMFLGRDLQNIMFKSPYYSFWQFLFLPKIIL